MSQQSQSTFTLRIASDDVAHTGTGTASCRATSDEGRQAVYSISSYRGQQSGQYTLSSMHGLSAGSRNGGGTFYRRAG